jgi:alanyl-tRNA synthetase
VTDVTAGQLKKMVEHLAAQLPSHVVLLAANMGGTAQFVCSVSADQQQTAGLSAGKLVQQAAQVCGGGGGGKPGFAQAGAKEATKIAEALAVVAAAVAASAAS